MRTACLLLWIAIATIPATLVAAQDTLPPRVAGTVTLDGEAPALTDMVLDVAFPNLRFRRPVYVTHPRDGSDRLFVLEQDGVVSVFENRRDVARAEPVLDLTAKVRRDHNEEGLLGLAFHPNFRDNRWIFVNYSASDPRRNVISRFTLDRAGRVADPASERVVLELEQPWGNHNGGMIEFGPDGYLYISFGDGGSGGDPLNSGQDRGSLLGKILRLDVDHEAGKRAYAIPAGNPFADARDGTRPEIWAWGLRNVWRFSFDRATGALWAGDVGQNTWEEIDVIRRGRNYGWRAFEGFERFQAGKRGKRGGDPEVPESAVEKPVWAYGRDDGVSVTGGYVYRGARLPELQGAYLVADYGSGKIWALRHSADGEVANRQIASGRSIASFGEDRDGEVYLCSFDQRIYRLVPAATTGRKLFPQRLSDTGIFAALPEQKPRAAFVPYEINVAGCVGGARAARWVMAPRLEVLQPGATSDGRFPAGTLWVQTLADPDDGRRLETRILTLREGGAEAWSFAWNEAQTDALLVAGSTERTYTVSVQGKRVERSWVYPSRADCMRCHVPGAGYVLGFRMPQLNRPLSGGAKGVNQLAELARIGLIAPLAAEVAVLPRLPATADAAVAVADRARAWLDVQCAHCHAPGGPGGGAFDLRMTTALEAMKVVNAEPSQGDLGHVGAKLLVPGKPEQSLLWLRLHEPGAKRMPPVGAAAVEEAGAALVRDWIRGLK